MAPIKRRKIRLKTREARKFGTARQVLHGMIFVVSVVLLCAGIWYVTRMDMFTIDEVSVSGGETVSHDEIKGVVEGALVGDYFFLVPHRFTYFYPYTKIMDDLAKIPKIYAISVIKDGNKKLDISFREYIPHALWCIEPISDGNCYYLNTEGFAFAKAPRLSGTTFVRYVVEGETELLQKNVFTPEELASSDAFIARVANELDFRIGSVTYTDVGDVVYHVNGGGDLLTAKSMDRNDTFQNLKTILKSKEFNHLRPGNFKYIDLRFGSKVFVNEELDAPEESA